MANVAVEELPEVTDAGLNEAVAPAGRPLAENVTVCAVPEVVVVEIVDVVDPPAVVLPEVGLSDMEKSLTEVVQPGSWKEASLVFQLKLPLAGMYWFVYQNVQSSAGSMDMLL